MMSWHLYNKQVRVKPPDPLPKFMGNSNIWDPPEHNHLLGTRIRVQVASGACTYQASSSAVV